MARPKKNSPFADPQQTAPRRIPMSPPQLTEQEAAVIAQERASAETTVEAPGNLRRGRLPDGSERIPFGRHASRFPKLPEREGYHRRWINDVRDRIAMAQRAGYTFVQNAAGENICVPGGFYGDKAINIYAMEMPQEWRDEDFEAQQEKLNAQDKLIYSGKHKEEPGDNRYVPSATPIKFRVDHGSGRG